ncbi:MAG: hypothetical protein K0R57_967 [Paenibacillaceae bacterium]|jgi:lysophospholipase L1-like esterase|nr:hypothetical protein [Paenibacillaceae bacterium]
MKDWMEYGHFEEMMAPFWSSQVMTEESVLLVSEGGEAASAPLLFRPVRILRVRHAGLGTEYKEGQDWVYEEGRVRRPEGSQAPFMTLEELYPPMPPEEAGQTVPKVGGGYILTHKALLHNRQLAVTYLHTGEEWNGPVPAFAGHKLERTVGKLKRGASAAITLYGDSIAAGYDSSSRQGIPPYQPAWGNLLAESLRRAYPAAPITFRNPSVGGKSADWGLEQVEELVSIDRPDLVILAFGMNDGTGHVPPALFGERISGIMDHIRVRQPEVEFILVAPIVPNRLAALPNEPERSFLGEQLNYLPVLERLSAQAGCALLDMTSVHSELLRHKRYWDMTGNHINHPNDYLSRWYAQMAAAMLTE